MYGSFKKETIFILIGSLFILIGILCNEWMLAALFSEDGAIALSRRVLIWIFDIVMVVIGITIIMKKKSLDFARLKYGISAIILILFVVEIGLHIANFVMYFGEDTELKDTRYLLSPFKGKGWAKELFREYDELTGGYKEFRGWGKDEYHGKHVSINADGSRKTWNPVFSNREKPKKLYVFGPSAIWGFGARDDYTIPSFVSKVLNERGYHFTVQNYGEWGYAFNQELVYLITLLRDGHRPDYVIFYGWADIYNAYQAGKPGTLHWSFSIRSRMKEHSDWEHIRIGITNLLSKYSMIYREAVKIIKTFDPPESEFTEIAHKYDDDQLRTLLKDTIGYFSSSYELLDNLSKIYGFKYISFWMPIIFTEEKLTEEESTVDIRLGDKTLAKMYKFANDTYKTDSFSHFYNVSDALKGRMETYYLDMGHLSEKGNEVVARRLVSILEKEYLVND